MYGIYETAGHMVSASEYGGEVYADAIDFFQIQLHVKKIFFCTWYVDEVPFIMLWVSTKIPRKPFCY